MRIVNALSVLHGKSHQLTFAGELSVVLAARLVVADDADEVLVDLALALAVGGRRLLMLGEDEYVMNGFNIPVEVQGDTSAWLIPPFDLVPTVPAADGPLLWLPAVQAGWRNIPN